MTLAIIGCGHIAQAYADGLAAYPDLDLVATADLQIERAEALAAPHGATAFPDAKTLLAESDAAVVANLTLHSAHAPVTEMCLDAGRHVFSEKPLALDPATARNLVEHADARGCVLGCAPLSGWADAQQQAAHLLRTGHVGTPRIAYAVGNFGRLTEWNANPEPFLRVGPLYDGGVYPLHVLTTTFGPVARVRTADAALLLDTHTHAGRTFSVDTPDHVTAVLEMADGPLVQLTASMYVPYQTRHFSSLEVHGDSGSLYLNDVGNFDGAPAEPHLQVARLGRTYQPLPLRRPPTPLSYASGIADVARAAASGKPPLTSGRQAAHLVSIIDGILESARTGASIPVDAVGFERPGLLPWPARADAHRTVHPLAPDAPAASPNDQHEGGPEDDAPEAAALSELPPVGFGCSRYRGGTTYVDLEASMADALAAGVRLFDTAELYGTEAALGRLIRQSSGPARDRVFVVSKVWNTNHRPEHLRAAARDSLDRLGLERVDAYLLHTPIAWQHRGPLGDMSDRSHEDATARTFPTAPNGTPLKADVTLRDTWAAMEQLVHDGLTRHIGLCNASHETLVDLIDTATIPPRLLQIECHPYHHPQETIDVAHANGLRVMAHSPLSAPGLLRDAVLQDIATAHGVSTAQVVLRWLVHHTLVPIPSSTRAAHVHANANVFHFSLSQEEMNRIDGLHRDDFSR